MWYTKEKGNEVNTVYRKGNLEDCKSVYRLMCQLEQKELPFERFSEIYQHQVEDDRYYHLLCERDGSIVSALNLRFEEQLHHAAKIAEVLEFAVDASCRSMGIGKGMFAKGCEIAKEFGCSQIELATNQLRKDAHRFYEREGMHNFHYKFSKSLTGEDVAENVIGR